MIDIQNPAHWDMPLFPIAIAAEAARVAPATMRMWFDRKRVALTEYDSASSPEQPARLLTLRSVLALAVTADLSRGAGGLDVSTAMAVAKHWAYVQHGGTIDGQSVEALPAGLFPGDRVLTVLIHHGGDRGEVRPVQFEAATGELRGLTLMDAFPSAHPVRARPTLVALNWIDRHARGVCEAYLQAKEG